MASHSHSAILILSPFVFPEPISSGKYNTEVAKGLRDAGHAVTVLASEPLYPDWVPQPTLLSLEGIEIVRGGGGLWYPRTNAPRRLVLEMWYAGFIASRLPFRRRHFAAAVAVLPPVGFVPLARWILPRGTPFTGIVHDLQSVFVQQGHSAFRRILARFVTFLEGAALRSCDRLIFLSESMAVRAIEAHGLEADRCRVHLPFVTLPEKGSGRSRLSHLFPEDRKHVVYAGALGEKQDPDKLLACLAAIQGIRNDVDCHVFSRGPAVDRLKQKFGASAGVRFHDLVEDADLAELYLRSDIQLVPQKPGTATAALPSKLPNLIVSGVPILAICDPGSELAAIVESADAGGIVSSWKPEDVAIAVDGLLRLTVEADREVRRAKAAAYARDKFSLESVLDSIVTQGRAGA